MPSDAMRTSSERDDAYRHPPDPDSTRYRPDATGDGQRRAFFAATLQHPALRAQGNRHAHASLMAHMQHTYGNLRTRRAVQRAVTVDEMFTGAPLDEEDLKKQRQTGMSDEEKTADSAQHFMDETDRLDRDWEEMSPHDRQMMSEDRLTQTRSDIEMQEMARTEDAGFYERCPHPEEDQCGLAR